MSEYSQLKYNLYELLNVPYNAPKELIEKKYRKIISKFHPDKKRHGNKLSPIEEELYYDITEAHYILTNQRKRFEYNMFISGNNNQSQNNNYNYQDEIKKAKEYVPDTKEEAFKQYMKQSEKLYERHGTTKYNNGNIKKNLKKMSQARDEDVGIIREDFRGIDDFNNQFTQRKKYGGNYSDKIVKYEGNGLVPFDLNGSKLNATSLKNFHNMYSNETVTGDKRFTSTSQAFLLQPHTEIDINNNLDEDINKYKNQQFEFDY